MGTHQGGDGGNVPPDGDRSPDEPVDLPEVPPDWGVIPDDLSELAEEAEQIRQELASGQQHDVPTSHPEEIPATGSEPSVGVPLLIMSVAVVITLVSLFAMAWSGSATPDQQTDPGAEPSGELPRVALTDALGGQVPVAGQAPAAILLIEECEDCSRLVSATVAAAPAGVTVVTVGRSVPDQPPGLGGDPAPLRLADPNGVLRSELGLGPPTNAATVVLVDQHRQVTRTAEDVTSIGQFQSDLTSLGQ